MFRRLTEATGTDVSITIDGRPAKARKGETVASAMLAAGAVSLRNTPVSGAPRLPFCMMGVCFDCLVAIDGSGNRQSCMIVVADGMRIETQRGKREVGK